MKAAQRKQRRTCAERIRAAAQLRRHDVPRGETPEQHEQRLLESAEAALRVAYVKLDTVRRVQAVRRAVR